MMSSAEPADGHKHKKNLVIFDILTIKTAGYRTDWIMAVMGKKKASETKKLMAFLEVPISVDESFV